MAHLPDRHGFGTWLLDGDAGSPRSLLGNEGFSAIKRHTSGIYATPEPIRATPPSVVITTTLGRGGPSPVGHWLMGAS